MAEVVLVHACMDCGKVVSRREMTHEQAVEADLYGKADRGLLYMYPNCTTFEKETVCDSCYQLDEEDFGGHDCDDEYSDDGWSW